MRTSVIPVSAPSSTAARYLSCLRLPEILVLQGSPLLGAAFALRHLAAENVGLLALLIVANVCLMAHIFLLNDWSGLTADLMDPNKTAGVFTARGISRKEIGGLTASLRWCWSPSTGAINSACSRMASSSSSPRTRLPT